MKKSPSRKALTLGVAGLLAASLLAAGCSGPSEDPSAASGDGNVKLVFHTWLPTQDQWPAIYEAFQKEHPEIEIEFIREEEGFEANLDNSILAGETPDLYGIRVASTFDSYAEFALPTDEYASEWIGKLNEAAVEQTKDAEGVGKAIPILTAGMEFYLYNKTLMDEIGVELPTNYDELVAVSKAARDAGYSPFALGGADTWHNADFFVWLSTQYGAGDDVFKAASGEIPWDSENLVAAGKAWQKLFTDGVFQDAATTITTYPQARDDYFLARKSIAFPTGSWHVGAALTTSPEVPGTAVEKDEIGMAAFPQIGDKDNGVTSGVDFSVAISKDSSPEKQKAAATFLEFLATGTGQQLFVNTLQGFPVSKDIQVELGADETQLGKDSVKLVTEDLQNAKYARKLIAPGNESLETDLGVVLQNIASGADVQKELATLNK